MLSSSVEGGHNTGPLCEEPLAHPDHGGEYSYSLPPQPTPHLPQLLPQGRRDRPQPRRNPDSNKRLWYNEIMNKMGPILWVHWDF